MIAAQRPELQTNEPSASELDILHDGSLLRPSFARHAAAVMSIGDRAQDISGSPGRALSTCSFSESSDTLCP